MPYLSHIYLNFSQFLLYKAQISSNGFICSIGKRLEKENTQKCLSYVPVRIPVQQNMLCTAELTLRTVRMIGTLEHIGSQFNSGK